MFGKVLDHPFFNKRKLAEVIIDAKNIESKAVIFYRKKHKETFSEQEVSNMKKELVDFAKLILKECK